MNPRFLLSVLVVAGLAAAGTSLAYRYGDQPVKSVRIAAEFQHVSRAELEEAMRAELGAGFFSISVERIRARLLELAWVRDASVRRVWPESLHVAVTERTPVARFGERALLESDGAMFAPEQSPVPAGLPLLHGPPGSERRLLERYRSLAAVLTPLQLSLRELAVTPRGAARAVLESGIVLALGRAPEDANLEQFARAFNAVLRPRLPEIEEVDLRYANGFAVRWKKAPAPAAEG
jgi:cell division protein FtsQ